MNHYQQLEAEAIEILREAVAGARKPVMMYSIGKDSSVTPASRNLVRNSHSWKCAGSPS